MLTLFTLKMRWNSRISFQPAFFHIICDGNLENWLDLGWCFFIRLLKFDENTNAEIIIIKNQRSIKCCCWQLKLLVMKLSLHTGKYIEKSQAGNLIRKRHNTTKCFNAINEHTPSWLKFFSVEERSTLFARKKKINCDIIPIHRWPQAMGYNFASVYFLMAKATEICLEQSILLCSSKCHFFFVDSISFVIQFSKFNFVIDLHYSFNSYQKYPAKIWTYLQRNWMHILPNCLRWILFIGTLH